MVSADFSCPWRKGRLHVGQWGRNRRVVDVADHRVGERGGHLGLEGGGRRWISGGDGR